MGKNILFFSTPAYGHVSCVLPVIKGLVDRGHHVTWFCTAKYKSMVLESGAGFIEYKGGFDDKFDLATITSDFYNLLDYSLKLNRKYYKLYLNRINWDKYDLLLYDSMCTFAKNIAVKKKLKSICLCTTMAYNKWTFVMTNMGVTSIPLFVKHGKDIVRKVAEEMFFRRSVGLPKVNVMDLFVNSGDKTLVFTPTALQPYYKTFPKSFIFVGTTIKAREALAAKKEKMHHNPDDTTPVDIYISLGTIFTENEALLKKIMNDPFFSDKKVIINVGNLKMESPKPNIKLVSHTNQIELLKHCKMFINHGGLNSVYESAYRLVPQVCIPQQEEQRMTALVAKHRNIATYSGHFDIKKIKRCFEGDYDMKQIRKYARIIEWEDGTKKAIKIIEAQF